MSYVREIGREPGVLGLDASFKLTECVGMDIQVENHIIHLDREDIRKLIAFLDENKKELLEE